MKHDLYDEFGTGTDEQDGWYGEVLAEVLCDEYADADLEALDEAVAEMLDALTPAEAFGLTKALHQIASGAGRVVSDPAFSRIAAGVLPVAGGALGTVVGGPLGTALGTQLGTAAVKALPPPRPSPGVPRSPTPAAHQAAAAPPAAAGSSAAAQGLVLTQHPDVLKGLLALAVGEHGRKTVNGVPVAALLNMVSSVFGKAAAEADELMYVDTHGDAEDLGAASWIGDEQSLYTALVDADNAELAEEVGWR